MSDVAEMAREEAERAEAEPDENEQAEEEDVEPTPVPEPEPDQPTQLTEQEAEREFKKLETAAQRYLKAAMPITKKLGMPVQACPLCDFPGLAIPRQANEVTSDVEAAILAFIGKGAEPDFRVSDQYHRCSACDGWGEVLTGAQKDISKTAICNPCGGKGFVLGPIQVPAPAPNGASSFPGADVQFQPIPQGIADAWGRPAGHPHWGSDPAKIGV